MPLSDQCVMERSPFFDRHLTKEGHGDNFTHLGPKINKRFGQRPSPPAVSTASPEIGLARQRRRLRHRPGFWSGFGRPRIGRLDRRHRLGVGERIDRGIMWSRHRRYRRHPDPSSDAQSGAGAAGRSHRLRFRLRRDRLGFGYRVRAGRGTLWSGLDGNIGHPGITNRPRGDSRRSGKTDRARRHGLTHLLQHGNSFHISSPSRLPPRRPALNVAEPSNDAGQSQVRE